MWLSADTNPVTIAEENPTKQEKFDLSTKVSTENLSNIDKPSPLLEKMEEVSQQTNINKEEGIDIERGISKQSAEKEVTFSDNITSCKTPTKTSTTTPEMNIQRSPPPPTLRKQSPSTTQTAQTDPTRKSSRERIPKKRDPSEGYRAESNQGSLHAMSEEDDERAFFADLISHNSDDLYYSFHTLSFIKINSDLS